MKYYAEASDLDYIAVLLSLLLWKILNQKALIYPQVDMERFDPNKLSLLIIKIIITIINFQFNIFFPFYNT